MTPEERADRIARAVYPPLTPFLVSEIAAAIRAAENDVLKRMPTPEQVQALADAMWQLLDDMGEQGLSVCPAAKAQARVALEPFLDEPEKVVTPGNDTRERITTKVVTSST